MMGLLLAQGASQRSRSHGSAAHFREGNAGWRADTHRGRGRRVQVDDAAHVGSGCVDGRVQTEARGVHREAAAALLHYLSQDVHLDLGQGRRETYDYRTGRGPSLPSPEVNQHTATHWCAFFHHT